ncbi:hypothetical protein DWB61_04420 [Ancylomarina euxinus]|uniref:Uncharacterized protein n=1 Tax=Ancylomarina euxinus TaxID=2283627 RepID=A0A425Y578_9BACT|nr:hypothetical protein [Ancylomarina euxinus]MCZ4694341.1 hypothetical protein [Ancylomarina euxinus]MUP14328.1 hypothetical protein [Ancylomarina euxinus]RRG23642.1 hypothetical protein DWB61_04420 [Ancylomarina euxinus]
MDKQKYIEDLKDIKQMMNRSSRFISLSGLSGISAGILAIIGAYLAYQTIYANQDYLVYRQATLSIENLSTLLVIALATLLLSIGSGIFFTTRKAKRNKQKLWDSQSKTLLINLFIPLATGGVLCLILLLKGFIGIIAPLTLIFYGLALVNASKYTLEEIRSLGIVEIILGLLGIYFIGYGLIIWTIGFGILHIVYGIIMHLKYGS